MTPLTDSLRIIREAKALADHVCDASETCGADPDVIVRRHADNAIVYRLFAAAIETHVSAREALADVACTILGRPIEGADV